MPTAVEERGGKEKRKVGGKTRNKLKQVSKKVSKIRTIKVLVSGETDGNQFQTVGKGICGSTYRKTTLHIHLL